MGKYFLSEAFDQQYELQNKLGEGTFATVYSALDKDSGQIIAIKQVYVQKTFLEDAEVEVNNIKGLNSDHVIKIFKSSYDSSEYNLNIAMELCKSSLRAQIDDHQFFDFDRLLLLIVQVTSAFLQLESKNLMHLDLKPQNILTADEEGKYYKVCDFGCSQISQISRLSGYQKNVFGTFNYLAPEIFLNYQGFKTRSSADIWSFGITLYEVIFWRYPFPQQGTRNINRNLIQNYFYKKGFQINFEASQNAPHSIIELIKMMLAPLPKDRINWKELKDRLMKDLNVQEHEFMNIKDVVDNFIPVIDLFLNVLKMIATCVQSSKHLFWKSNSKFMLELKEILIYYLYIICDKFNIAFEIKKANLESSAVQKVNDLLKFVVNERQKCGQKIKSFELTDLNYRETQLNDELKVCLEKIYVYRGSMDSTLELLEAFCSELSSVIRQDQSLFTNCKIFDKSLKIKI